MDKYSKKNVRLEEAMTMEIVSMFRKWETSGCHVQLNENVPKNAEVFKTEVMKFSDEQWSVKLHWTVKGDIVEYSLTMAEFSSLEELRKSFPQLFELDGALNAFD